jgi:hypothetical protein
LRQRVVRGFDVSVNDDTTVSARRCWDGDNAEVIELHVEGSGNPFLTLSACLTPIQATALAYHLLHEANVPLEVQ